MAEDNITSRNLTGARNELANQWLGADDFSRVLSKLQEGNLLGSLKSGLTGALELGGTVASILGAPFSGGGSLVAPGALAGGTRLATKAPRIAKALQKAGESRQALGKLSGAPRQKLIEGVGPLQSLRNRMLLEKPSVGAGLALYDPAVAQASTAAMRSAGRNPLRALGVVDPYFNYKGLGTVGTGRVGRMLPTSPAAYVRGLTRASGLVPFAGQSLPSFVVQRSVVPRMFGAFLEGPPADVGEGIVRTGINQLSQADLDALIAAAELGDFGPQASAMEQYLRGIPQ